MKKINEKKATICIPVFNRSKLVSRAINSALNQSEYNIEVVVIDNNSSDSTYEVVKNIQLKDNRIRLYRNHENIGAIANFKKAVEISTTNYVTLLGSDDFLEADFVKNKLKAFYDNPSIPIVSGPVKLFNDVNGVEKLTAHYEYRSGILTAEKVNKNFYRNYLISYFCMFRKDQIIKYYTEDYSDPFNWGVYKKGYGLDIINCLKIINEGQFDHSIYYQVGGAYCFTNPKKRQSEIIIEKNPKKITRTFNDYCYSTFLFRDYLNSVDKKLADDFIKFKIMEFSYEMVREVIISKANLNDAYIYFKKFKSLHLIGNKIIVYSLMKLPYYFSLRIVKYFIRKIRYD